MKAYYVQKAEKIFPIFGVTSKEEAMDFCSANDRSRVVETNEDIYMNPATGSVDFASGWDEAAIERGDVVPVRYDCDLECWVETE